MNNNTQNTTKPHEIDLEGYTRGCFGCSCGLIVGMVFLVISTMLLYNAIYDEYGPVDLDGDYVLDNIGQESPVGTWVIENPYYFAHEGITIEEMENWRQVKLIISEDGTFELIQPTELLGKLLLISSFDLKKRESFDVYVEDMEVVRQAMNGSIVGQWSKLVDDNNKTYFCFQAEENNIPQRIQIARVNDDSIKTGRLDEGPRLHWSIYNHVLYPKEGIVWKNLNP